MSDYNVILVALDVFAEHLPLVDRLKKLAVNKAEIHLSYVIQPQKSIAPYGGYLERDFSEDIKKQAEQKLSQIAEALPHNNITLHTPVGSIGEELEFLAEQRGAELIIIGAHNGASVLKLLGSVANAVINRAHADVLTVKMS